jgi:WD40 repeat protein
MAKVFVSYSRKDITFAKRLTAELQKCELDFWIDWEGIPPTVDWWREIEKGIEESDIYLFLVSPDSVKSRVCGQEIDSAVKNGKRIIPVVVRDSNWDETPPQLRHLNYIFIRESDDFEAAVNRLITAIQTDYEWAATHRRLQVKALDWERNNKDSGFLLRRLDLLDAEQDLATNTSKDPHPTDLQREFVFESRKATDRQRRITTWAAIGAAIALAGLAVFGLDQADKATKQATIARAGELAAQSVSTRTDQFDLSLLLSVEAFREADTIQSRSALLDNTQHNPQLLQFLNIAAGGIFSLNFSPTNEILTSVSCKAEYVIFCTELEMILWDVETHESMSQSITGLVGEITRAAMSPDGKTLAFATLDHRIIFWDTATSQPVGPSIEGLNDEIWSIAFLEDRKLLASVGDSVILWDVENGQRIGQPISAGFAIYCIAFSPDGKTLALGSVDSIILWDMEAGQPIEPPIDGLGDNITSLAFSSDGRTLAIAGNTIILWDVLYHERIELIGPVRDLWYQSLAFSPDGRTLASGSCEQKDVACIRGIISVWDLTDNRPIRQLIPGGGGLGFAFSPNGKTLALPNDNHSIVLWDIRNHQIPGKRFSGNTGLVHSVAFRPDGKILASAGDSLIFWHVDTGQIIGEPIKRESLGDIDIYDIAFSPDGKTLALGGLDTVILWDIDGKQSIQEPIKGVENYQITFTFSPDSKTLVIGSSGSKEITFREIATGHSSRPALEQPGGYVTSLRFTRDGKTLISAGHSINFWNMATGRLHDQALTAHRDGVSSVDLSPDGKTLASGSCGGSSLGFCVQGEIILWDVESRQPIGNPLLIDGYSVDRVVFNPNGGGLATLSGGIVLWDMDPSAWARSNCQRAGRNLTRDEWIKYFPKEDYRQTCEQWPPAALTEPTSTP